MAASKIPLLSASDDIQNPTLSWRSTIAFRRFRRRLSELSRLQWTSVLGAHYVRRENARISGSEKLTFVDTTLGFAGNMLPLTRDEMDVWLGQYENEVRNAALVLCSGALEAYLKRAGLLHLLASGYASPTERFKLSEVGHALGAPVVKRSTVPGQLKYVQGLLGVNFNKHLAVWDKAYKERCTLAHQAGVISDTNQEDILSYDENIQTSWPALRQTLNSTNQIAAIIDQKIGTAPLLLLELEFELAILKKAGKLPARKDLWTFVHQELRCFGTPKPTKRRIEADLY
jgi:hypothetical protein